MAQALSSIQCRLDRAGIALSALCAVHCVLGLLVVSVLGLGGGLMLSPSIHQIGLVLAIVVAVLTLGLGILRHGRLGPIAIASAGICLMALAVVVGHGSSEALLTILGVALLAFAHMRNLRHAA